MKHSIKSILTGIILAVAIIPGAQAANIHFDIIETQVGSNPETLSLNWGGQTTGFVVTGVADDWMIDIGSAGHAVTEVGRTINWVDDTSGLFNKLTVVNSTTLRYQSDLATADATFGPFIEGVSFYIGTDTATGNDIFASAHENQSTVPVPGTLALLALGVAGFGFSKRKVKAV